MTTHSLFKIRRAICLLTCLSLLSACATQPRSPSAVESVSFGKQPADYKKIVKTYLDKKRNGSSIGLENIDFLNEPNKYIYERFTQEEFGYRVCALIPNKNMEGIRSHFFLIKSGKVIKHAYDSGMISLSDKFCNTVMLASERKVKTLPAVTPVAAKAIDEASFKYISCQSKNNELLFAFNPERKELLQHNNGKQVAKFNIQTLSETFIVATTIDSRVSINRISGSMQYQTKRIESKAQCVLTNKQRF
ncbi:MAG: hypothetical protein ACI8PW_000655 [Methylophilaceae bacterium]